jgi:hypothetical protein
MMVALAERSFLKLKYFCELFLINNNSRDVKWLDDSIYRKKLLDEIDLNDIRDDFVSQNVKPEPGIPEPEPEIPETRILFGNLG